MNPILFVVSLASFIGLASSFAISPAPAPYFGPFGPMFPGAIGRGLGLGLGGIGGIGGIGLGLGLGGLLGPFGPAALLGPLGGMGLTFGMGSFGVGGNARLGGIRGRRALDQHCKLFSLTPIKTFF